MSEIIFTMGTPAAGKSTVSKAMYPTYTRIDCDEIKETYPDYDPKNPGAVHERSTADMEKLFKMALISGEGSYVVDGTGANAEKMIRRMTEAKAAGFNVKLIYVVVPLHVSIKRNESRERTVPRAVVIEKYNDIRFAFEAVAPHADEVKVINNV